MLTSLPLAGGLGCRHCAQLMGGRRDGAGGVDDQRVVGDHAVLGRLGRRSAHRQETWLDDE